MIIETKNSVYELENGYVRRVSGSKKEHLLSDKWTECTFIVYPQEGEKFTFIVSNGLITTSVVTSIDDELDQFGWAKNG